MAEQTSLSTFSKRFCAPATRATVMSGGDKTVPNSAVFVIFILTQIFCANPIIDDVETLLIF